MSDNVTKEFAEKLQSLIFESGKSIKQLAAEIGVPSGSLSKYQNNAAEPGISNLHKIAKFFEVSADYMLGTTDQKTSNIDDKAMHEALGLSDIAIVKLKGYKKYLPGILIPSLNHLIESENDAEIASYYRMQQSFSPIDAGGREALYKFEKHLSMINPQNKVIDRELDYHEGPLALIDDYFNSIVDKKGCLSIEIGENYIGSVDSQQIIDTVIFDKIKEVLTHIRKKQDKKKTKPKIRYEKKIETLDEGLDKSLLSKIKFDDMSEEIIDGLRGASLELVKKYFSADDDASTYTHIDRLEFSNEDIKLLENQLTKVLHKHVNHKLKVED